MKVRERAALLASVFVAGTLLSACATTGSSEGGGEGGTSNTTKGAVIGGAGGAILGGIIGNQAGSTAAGAIIGAAVGGAAGAAIGRQMDKQAEELAADIPDAEVERVGEGIKLTFASGILFAVDSDRLAAEAQANLTELAQSLLDYPGTDVLIVGHTDSTGAEEYNQRLSERRAESAARFLASRGVQAVRMQTVGLGETEPVADNDTEVGRRENRRVEVSIFASEEMRAEMQKRG